MGLYNLVKRGASALKGKESSPADQANKIKFEQNIYEAREKGRLKGAAKRAEEEGYRKAYGSGSSGKTGRVGGALNRLDSGARAVGHGLNNAERMFGVSGGASLGNFGSGGSGFDFGLGLTPERQQQPTRTTRISPTGVVTIKETGGNIGQPNKPKKRKSGVHNFFDDLDEYNPF
jgi:hypothetical protein